MLEILDGRAVANCTMNLVTVIGQINVMLALIFFKKSNVGIDLSFLKCNVGIHMEGSVVSHKL